MLLNITDAQYLGDYRFRLSFNDERTGVVDIRALAADSQGAVFAPLRAEAFVRTFVLEHGTLCWHRELDVAPEYLYYLAFQNDPSLQELFQSWGYLEEHSHA